MENSVGNLSLSVVGAAHFSSIDYTVFSALVAISLAIGLYFGISGRNGQSAEEYLHGGHSMRPIPVAFSLIASIVAASTLTTEPVEIYLFGWLYFLLIPALLVVLLLANWLFLPVFYENNINNIYAYLECRFSKCVRSIVSFAFVVNGLLYIPITLYIPALAFSEVTGHNVHAVNAIVCYCCVFYTLFGGIKAVVWTDVVQGVVICFSLLVVVVYGIRKAGGLDDIIIHAVAGKRLFVPDFSLDLMQRHTFWNMFLGLTVAWTWNVCFDQKCVQRLVAMSTLSRTKQTLSYFICGLILFMFLNMSTGIIMYAYYHRCDPIEAKIVSKADKMIPHFVKEVVGSINGMPGIFISSLFSASLSTVSTTLNSQAGVIYADFIRPLKIVRHTETNANYCMKMMIFATGTLAILCGFGIERMDSLFQAVYTLTGICAGPIVGVFTLGMLCPWANKHGALAALLIGIIVTSSMIINGQIALANGELHYDTLPLSTAGCLGQNVTRTHSSSPIANETISTNDEFALYKISFMWYGPLGLLLTWAIGIVVSLSTGGYNLTELNENLLSPCIRSLITKKCRHVPLQMHSENSTKPTERAMSRC